MDILKASVAGLVFFVVLFEFVGWGATNSPNPLDFFSESNTLAKIALIILAIIIFSELLFVVSLGRIPEDADCQDPQCGKGMRTFYSVYGGAVKCPKCGRWYHSQCWIRFNGRKPPPSMMLGCRLCSGEEGEMPSRPPEDDIFGERY